MSNDSTHKQYLKRLADYWSKEASRHESRELAVHFECADSDIYDSLVDEVLYYATPNPDDHFLEVGCGNGLLLERFLARGFDSLEGCDISEGLVNSAKEFLPTIPLTTTDASSLEMYETEKFDLVFCHSIFHYFPDHRYAKAAVAEWYRVTKPGGRIVILDILGNYWEQWYDKPDALEPVRRLVRRIKGKQDAEFHPFFTPPELFFDALSEKRCKIYPMLEVINKKPIIFKQFRYNVLIEKGA